LLPNRGGIAAAINRDSRNIGRTIACINCFGAAPADAIKVVGKKSELIIRDLVPDRDAIATTILGFGITPNLSH
jgi:hypothetical protein